MHPKNLALHHASWCTTSIDPNAAIFVQPTTQSQIQFTTHNDSVRHLSQPLDLLHGDMINFVVTIQTLDIPSISINHINKLIPPSHPP